jgi:hypothetical protein
MSRFRLVRKGMPAPPPPLGGLGTLSSPELAFPSGGQIGIKVPPDWQVPDALALATSASENMASPTIVTHALADGDTPGSVISMGLSLAGSGFAQAFGVHSGIASQFLSNKVKWGDTTAPTITTNAAQSITELFALSVALAADKTIGSWAITGGADQTQFEISGTTLRWFGNGTQNYDVPIDLDTNNTYVVQVAATDLGGNVTNKTITTTVTQADKTPNAFSFTPVVPATPSTQYTSNTITVAGLTPGLSVPVTLTGGGTYSKNGGAFTSAAGTAQNGDTFALRVTSGSGASDVLNLSLSIGLGSGNWTVSNTTNTATLTTTNGASKNSNVTVSGSPPLNGTTNSGTAAAMMVRANQSASGKRVFEGKVTHLPDVGHAFIIGVDDGTGTLGPSSSTIPGNNDSTGVVLAIFPAGSGLGWDISKGGSFGVQSGANQVALNDVIRVEVDTTPGGASNTVKFKLNGTQLGTTEIGLGSITTAFYAVFGGDALQVDWTSNFGQDTSGPALPSGYSWYGA